MKIEYVASPTITALMDSDAFCRLVVGPIGSGKSTGCVMELIQRCFAQKKGPDGKRKTRWGVVRNTYRELNDTTRATFTDRMRPFIDRGCGHWHESSFKFTLNIGDVEAEFLFRALNDSSDVKKLLSLELTGAWLNEAREIPVEILSGLKGRVGRFPAMVDGGPSWHGIICDTNPMAVGSDWYRLFKLQLPENHALFEQPSGMSDNAENVDNLVPGYYSNLCVGQEDAWVDEYVRAKYPAHDKGSVYGESLAMLEQVGATNLEFIHSHKLFAVFDLGVSDAMAIWWFLPNTQGGVDFVDYFEATGKYISDGLGELKRREELYGWEYVRVVLPHDARQRHPNAAGTVADVASDAYPDRVDVLPPLPVEEGISSLRYALGRLSRFHTRCADGLKALKAYRYAYDMDRRVYSRKPIHDWSSHGSDAARGAALYLKRGGFLTHAQTEAQPKPAPHHVVSELTLEELYEIRGTRRQSGRVD